MELNEKFPQDFGLNSGVGSSIPLSLTDPNAVDGAGGRVSSGGEWVRYNGSLYFSMTANTEAGQNWVQIYPTSGGGNNVITLNE